MKKEYEKPTLEVIEFEYCIQTSSDNGVVDFDVSEGTYWW